jgi:hypothetical protein
MNTRLLASLLTLLTTVAQAEEPPKEADEATFDVALFGQVFGGWDSTAAEGGDTFHELVLRRAELGAGFTHAPSDAGFLINVEALRSAGPQSLFGVDGDSIILRAKHAFGRWRPTLGPGALELRAGLIPDLWINALEAGYDLRGTSPLLAERARLFDTSDLGASASYAAFEGLFVAGIALTNGEGRAQREQNSGKNTTVVLTARPLTAQVLGEQGAWALHAAWRDGSTGVASAASHRIALGTTLAHPRLFAGAEYTRATGWQGRGDLIAQGVGGWLNGTLYLPWLGAYGRADHLSLVGQDESGVWLMQAGLYLDLVRATTIERPIFGFPQLRLYVGWSGERYDRLAAPLPGAAGANDLNTFMLTLSARGAGTP